ncbi:NADP-dependent oxidoreductase domain-containing protein, partial [Auriculariales sp. MPI-PUGE-AT-0066]
RYEISCNEDDISFTLGSSTEGRDWINRKGLSRKHIFDAVDASVARLGTYIDVLQIHRLDKEVPPEEIMEALHDVVKSGKVRYIGASSMYTHEFATLQFTAEKHGWTSNKTGVGLVPWSPLARGALTRPYGGDSLRSGTDRYYKVLIADKVGSHEGDIDKEVTTRVEKVAKDKAQGCAPILGMNSEKRIEEAVASLKVN